MTRAQEDEIKARRRGRNYALGGALLAFVLLIFAVTIVKLSGGMVIDWKGY